MYALKQRKDLDIDSFLNQSHGISYFNLALINGRLDDFECFADRWDKDKASWEGLWNIWLSI